MLYPILIQTDNGESYGVIIPDVPGCFSAGDSVDEAMAGAKEALSLHFEEMVKDGEAIPYAKTVRDHLNEFGSDGIWAVVDVDIEPYLGGSERVNVTIPKVLLQQADRRYHNRSAYITKLIIDDLSKNQESNNVAG